MGIDVGTLVKKLEYDEHDNWYMLCESYTKSEEYSEDYQRKLDVCLGVVIEAIPDKTDDPGVIVNWVHLCRYHTEIGQISQTGEHPDYLWEVGQL